MSKKATSKLKPPWIDSPDKKTWYQTRPCELSLTDLTDSKCRGEGVKPPPKSPKDHRLKNWDKWCAVRKKEHQKFSNVSGRTSCNLTMNSEQYYRKKQEDREILEFAEELQIPDEARGGLDYWGFPTEMEGGEGECSKKTLFVQQKKLEKGVLPTITKVGIPKAIKIEKDTVDEERQLFKTNFEKSRYKAKRENDLKSKINLLLPHKPDVDALMVVGIKPVAKEFEPYIKVPVITINMEDTSEVKKHPVEDMVENIVSLRIDNTIFLKESPSFKALYLRKVAKEQLTDKKNAWLLNFITKPYQNVTKSVTLQNMGTVALKCFWREVDSTVSYMKKRLQMPAFFFDKNELVLIPGEVKQINFCYVTSGPQINVQSWEFNTYPSFAPSHCQIIFKLAGLTLTDPFSIQRISSYINDNTALLVVGELLENIIHYLTSEKPSVVSYEDLMKDQFVFNAKNPNYHYHQKGVEKLKILYDKITSANSEEAEDIIPWDMSIKTLRNIIIEKEMPIQTELYVELKEILLSLLKPEFQISFDSKYMAVYSLLCQFCNRFEQEHQETMNTLPTSIQAVNATHLGHDLKNYIDPNHGRYSTYSNDSANIHDNEICYKMYGMFQTDFDKVVFLRRMFRNLELTIDNIEATLSNPCFIL